MAAKILKNITGSAITISDTGATIPASPTLYTIPEQDYFLWAASADIATPVNSGDIVVNDEVGDLSASDGLNYLLYPDFAFNQRFLSEPERDNNFVSKNTQEAIEELSENGGRFRSISVSFGRSGNVNQNGWLLNETVPSNIAGRLVPSAAVIEDVIVATVRVTNEDLSTFDLSIFEHDGDGINLTLIETYSIVSSRGTEIIDGITTLTPEKHIAMRITSGSAKNLLVTMSVTGTLPL